MGSLEELALVTVHRGAGPVKIWVSVRCGGVWEGGRPGYGSAFINRASSHPHHRGEGETGLWAACGRVMKIQTSERGSAGTLITLGSEIWGRSVSGHVQPAPCFHAAMVYLWCVRARPLLPEGPMTCSMWPASGRRKEAFARSVNREHAGG